MKNDNTKEIVKNVLKWSAILGLLLFVCLKNKTLFKDAVTEVAKIPAHIILLCLLLANLYFLAEGRIVSRMTSKDENRLNLWEGIVCAYLCAFYRVATLGSGTAVAQLYYYNTKNIKLGRASGMAMVQYTFMKMTVGVMGVGSFILLAVFADDNVTKYWKYMLAGSVVISLICIFLFVITISKTISGWVVWLGHKIVKEDSKLYDKLLQGEETIRNLQTCGRDLWKDKSLLLQIVLLNLIKFSLWYAIPGIYFYNKCDTNILVAIGLMAITNMVGCVMVAPSGAGTLEFCAAVFFSAVIPKGEYIAAMLVIYRFFTWIVPLFIGLIPALALRKHKQKNMA